MIATNIECPDDKVLGIDELVSGDLQITISQRRRWFQPRIKEVITLVIPKDRRCLIASLVIGQEPNI